MIDLKRILVPSDFSESSDKAVQYGIALARAFNARLHLLHVAVRHEYDLIVERERATEKTLADDAGAPVPPGLDDETSSPFIVQRAARELFEKSVPEREDAELHPEYVLRPGGVGGPYVEIVRFAKERNVDLIVMGTHGRGFGAHMLMGGVTEKMVRKAPCPVLTVRHPEHEFVIPEMVERLTGTS